MLDTNFLPDEYMERRLQRRTNTISLLLFVVVMGAVVAAFFVTDRQRSEIRSLQEQVNQRFEEAAKRLEQLDMLQRRKDAMVHKAQVSAALIERLPRSVMLAELVNNMPATLSLMDLNLSTRVLQTAPRPTTALQQARQTRAAMATATDAVPEIPQTEVSMYLIGLAPTDVEVAQFMTALSASPLFTDVNLIVSEEEYVEGRAMRRFRVEMTLNEDVDLKAHLGRDTPDAVEASAGDTGRRLDTEASPTRAGGSSPMTTGR